MVKFRKTVVEAEHIENRGFVCGGGGAGADPEGWGAHLPPFGPPTKKSQPKLWAGLGTPPAGPEVSKR